MSGEITDAGGIPTDLLVREYLRDLNEEALPNDIFEAQSAPVVYAGGKKPITLPEAGYIKLDAAAQDARDIMIPMIKDFSGDLGEGGLTDPRGTEEDMVLKSFKMQCNDIWHTHTNEAYGLLARDRNLYKLIEAGPKLEGRYFKSAIGRARRQMLTEGQSSNLLEYPHFNSAMLNPNWFLPGVDDVDQPHYSMTHQNHVDNIVHALNHAGTGVNAAASIHFLQRLQEWAFANLNPYEDGEGQYFIVVLPSPQVTWLKHNSNERALGQYYRNPDSNGNKMSFRFPGFVDKVDKLVICEDGIYPTITISGTPSRSDGTHDGTMTIQYRGMGSSDPRDFSAGARQVGWILGKSYGCEWFPEKLHWEYDYKWYDRKYGSGLFGVFGAKLVCFNEYGSRVSSTMQHDGSACLAFARPPREGYST
jgi:hypothetical protein